MHLANGPHQVIRRRVLEQIPQRPRFDSGKYLVVGRETGQDQDSCLRIPAGDLARRFDTIHSWHQQVHEDDVRPCLLGAQQSGLPGVRFSHHLEATRFGKQRADAFAHDSMIVDDQYADA